MNLKQYICLASLFLPIGTTAQTSNNHIIIYYCPLNFRVQQKN